MPSLQFHKAQLHPLPYPFSFPCVFVCPNWNLKFEPSHAPSSDNRKLNASLAPPSLLAVAAAQLVGRSPTRSVAICAWRTLVSVRCRSWTRPALLAACWQKIKEEIWTSTGGMDILKTKRYQNDYMVSKYSKKNYSTVHGFFTLSCRIKREHEQPVSKHCCMVCSFANS